MWIEAFALKWRLKPTSTLFKVCLTLICILPCNNHKSHVVRFYRHPTSQVGKLRFSNVGILAPSSSSTSVLTLGPLAEASAFSDSFVSLSSKPQRYDPCLQHPHLWVKGQAPKAPPAAIHTILSYVNSSPHANTPGLARCLPTILSSLCPSAWLVPGLPLLRPHLFRGDSFLDSKADLQPHINTPRGHSSA